MNQLTTSHKIKLWGPKPRTGGKTGWRVRWAVAGHERTVTMPEEAAKNFHSRLKTAWKTDGEAFDIVSGLPVSMALAELQRAQEERESLTVIKAITEYIDTKWDDASAKHRANLAEVLMWATMALLPRTRSKGDAVAVRRALRTRQFNTLHRAEATAEEQRWMRWAQENCPPITYLGDLSNVRKVLGDMQKQFNGKPRSANCKRRARSILNGFIEYAAEQSWVSTNQVAALPRSRKKSSDAIDRRRVANSEQKDTFIDSVRELSNGHRYVAYFALQAYAGLRPEEAIDFRRDDLELPSEIRDLPLHELTATQMECMATLHIHETAPVAGSRWTDSGQVRDDRGLKQRERQESRTIPSEPKLTRLLIEHLIHKNFVEGPSGEINTRPNGELLADSTIRKKFHAARAATLTPTQQQTMLLERPYDLRHSCISEWLADVGDTAMVAEWAGHSISVLLRVYAKCIDGRETIARQRIMQTRYGSKLRLAA